MVHSEKYKNYTIEVYLDDIWKNPRNFEDCFTKMVCFHGRYELGDKDHNYNNENYNSWIEVYKGIIKKEKPICILPLYLYDHSGITISTSPFSCRFDSGQVGYVYTTKKLLNKLQQFKYTSKKIRVLAEEQIKNEVWIYDQYIRGEIYFYKIRNTNGKIVDSCGGFYGEYDTESDLMETAKNSINSGECDE